MCSLMLHDASASTNTLASVCCGHMIKHNFVGMPFFVTVCESQCKPQPGFTGVWVFKYAWCMSMLKCITKFQILDCDEVISSHDYFIHIRTAHMLLCCMSSVTLAVYGWQKQTEHLQFLLAAVFHIASGRGAMSSCRVWHYKQVVLQHAIYTSA